RLLSPSRLHWLGTDDLGRDLLSRIIYGGRTSLTVGIVSVSIALAIGTLSGLVGGYYSGWAESVTMRLMDVMLAFPATLLAIFIVGIRGPGLNNAMLAIGVINIPIFARIVRGSVLRARQEDYVGRPGRWAPARCASSAGTSCPTPWRRSSCRPRSGWGRQSRRRRVCRSWG